MENFNGNSKGSQSEAFFNGCWVLDHFANPLIGATTFIITTFNIMTRSIMTLSIMTGGVKLSVIYAKCFVFTWSR
jgi:hypothetical protein